MRICHAEAEPPAFAHLLLPWGYAAALGAAFTAATAAAIERSRRRRDRAYRVALMGRLVPAATPTRRLHVVYSAPRLRRSRDNFSAVVGNGMAQLQDAGNTDAATSAGTLGTQVNGMYKSDASNPIRPNMLPPYDRVRRPMPPSLPRDSWPCVVLEAGANSWAPVWAHVAQRLSPFARVLSYDRAGFGSSDVDLSPTRTVESVAADLLAAIRNSGAAPPYVFVAHSLGALFVNAAVSSLPREDVLGIVYVDAASPDSVREIERIVPKSSPPLWFANLLSSLGLLRVLSPRLLRAYYDAFSVRLRAEVLATWSRGDWLVSYTREWTAALRYAGSHLPHPSQPPQKSLPSASQATVAKRKCPYLVSPTDESVAGSPNALSATAAPATSATSATPATSETSSTPGDSPRPDPASPPSANHTEAKKPPRCKLRTVTDAENNEAVLIDSVRDLELHLQHQHEQELTSATNFARERYHKGWLGALPISVIVPDIYDRTPGAAYVGQIQRRITEYSSNVELFEPTNCGHFVQLDQPDTVVQAVHSVLRRAQTARIVDDARRRSAEDAM